LTCVLTVGYYHLSGDSFDYLTLARNIFRGEGFTRLGLPEVYRQPGYPYLVVIFLFFIRDLELTGHFVSLLFGTMAVPALFWTARHLLPVRHALIATVLLALNPYFINAGSEALSETASTFFFILAIGFLFRTWDRNLYTAIISSALFGLFSAAAYLCRSESLLLFLAGLLLLTWRFRKSKYKGSFCILCAVISLIIVCLPYWSMLKKATGHFSLGGNSVNLIWYQSSISEKPPESFDPQWAPHPFDPIWPSVTHPADFSPVKYIIHNTPELVMRYFSNVITYAGSFCEVLFFGLGIILLFFGIRWYRRVIPGNRLYIIVAALVPISTIFFREGTDRLLIPYLPVFSIFMAIGLFGVIEWLVNKYPLLGGKPLAITIIFIVILSLLPMIKMMRHVGRQENWRHYRYRGAAAFHAGGRTVAVPATNKYKKLIKQMDRFNARYLVITRENSPDGHIKIPELKTVQNHKGLKLLNTFHGEIDLYERKK